MNARTENAQHNARLVMQQALSVKKTKEMSMDIVQNAPLDTGKILLH